MPAPAGRPDAPASLPLVAAHALGSPAPERAGEGLWRYAAAIPVDTDIGARLSMGEGATPLIAAGEPGVHLKLDFVSPTGSFKDRGAVVLVASALERGAGELIADSSGNAGSAIAAYAARAQLPCRVYVPERTSPAKQAQIAAYGAELALVAGDRTATAQAAQAAVRDRGAMYASHVHDPYFLQGTKTFAFEVWEQLGGEVPDVVVIPAGNGTLLLGAWIGFQELRAAGLIARVPALVAVQSERCAPVAGAWSQGLNDPVAVDGSDTAAEGIAIPRPARGAEMLAAIRDSGGVAVTVPEGAIAPARAELARRGVLVEPTAAVAWAAFRLGWPAPLEGARGRVVVALCGSGLKSPN